MIEKLQNSEEQGNLHIVENMDVNNLPEIMKSVLSLAHTPAEKDMLLMSALTACSSGLPNLYVKYGVAAKRYYPNLQLFIVGSAACGKGIANLALELIKPIHEKMPLIIPGDATYPAFYQTLAKQHGRGYIHESEGSVITDIWRSSTANYNTALRKAAEHETISRARCREASVIENPQISMVLTGTFSQYKALVPSIENGYFSRLITLIVDEHQAFNSSYVQPSENSGDVIKAAAEKLYHLYESLLFAHPREFSLTAEQKERLGKHLETAYPTLIRMLGEDFHSVVLRMAVHIERIAMILSALRLCEEQLKIKNYELRMECSDVDYQTAEMIGNKLILHMAQAYQLVKGTEKVEQPKVKPLDQKQILLSLLPEEFESKMLVDEAKAQGLTERTAFRWNDDWQQSGTVLKIRHGVYRKQVLCA